MQSRDRQNDAETEPVGVGDEALVGANPFAEVFHGFIPAKDDDGVGLVEPVAAQFLGDDDSAG